MTQYDFVRAWKNDADYDIEGPVIVLTLEDLKEVWAMAKAGPDYPGVFELFLKSKGIVTNQQQNT